MFPCLGILKSLEKILPADARLMADGAQGGPVYPRMIRHRQGEVRVPSELRRIMATVESALMCRFFDKPASFNEFRVFSG